MKSIVGDFKATIGKTLRDFEIFNPELILYTKLVEAKLKPQKKFKIGKIIVPLAFPNAKLAIDFDKRAYHFTEKWQIERDQKRDKYLAQKGWRVLHIEGLAIRRNIGLCIEKIEKALKPFLV